MTRDRDAPNLSEKGIPMTTPMLDDLMTSLEAHARADAHCGRQAEVEAAKADSGRQAEDGYKRERDEARGCTAAVAEGADEWKSRALAAESSLESMRQERDEAQDRAVSAQVHAEQLSDLLYRRVEEMRLRAEGAEADLMRRTQEYTADIQTAVRMNDAAERALREAREALKAPDADRCDCDGQKGQGCTICASSETPATEESTDARIRCGSCGKLAEGECSCPKETPGYYHPDPAVDAEIREEVKRRDEWDSAHGIRVGWHKRPASPASAPRETLAHDGHPMDPGLFFPGCPGCDAEIEELSRAHRAEVNDGTPD